MSQTKGLGNGVYSSFSSQRDFEISSRREGEEGEGGTWAAIEEKRDFKKRKGERGYGRERGNGDEDVEFKLG